FSYDSGPYRTLANAFSDSQGQRTPKSTPKPLNLNFDINKTNLWDSLEVFAHSSSSRQELRNHDKILA
ncbi:MAG: hypothetical protein NT002_09920, partial [candidate division Zixibacteria bacterium]|nr:hypothetical protein [candidate division Zixibacteria bacterium]